VYKSKLKIKALYEIKGFFWLLYSEYSFLKTMDVGRFVHASGDEEYTRMRAVQHSKHFKCNVSYVSPNSIFMLLDRDGVFLKILSADGQVGWIAYPEDEPWVRQNKYIVEVKP